MLLYHILNKKNIEVNYSLSILKKILDGSYRLLNKKEYSSNKKYDEYYNNIQNIIYNNDIGLPLYDIGNDKFYVINKEDLLFFIKNNHFRPLDEKLKNILSKDKIKILENFDLNLLENKLLNYIYYKNSEVGGDITLLKNPAYIKYFKIKPFLKKTSIINTALNLNVITLKDLPLNNNQLFKLYNKIKNIFFTKKELINHMQHIDKYNMNNIVKYYTFNGSYYFNQYLRYPDDIPYDEIIEKQIIKLNNLIRTSPKLDSEKLIFRFLHNDDFLKYININDIYVNDSFMSCTRKPNMNSKKELFGYILMKIYIPKNMTGACLFIEGDSVFKKEKEVLLAPGCKLKLLSINNDVEFYEFGKKINRNIIKKYEFQIVGVEKFNLKKHKQINIPIINIHNIHLDEEEDLKKNIKYFIKNYTNDNKFYLEYKNNKKLFYISDYNSIESYSKFFYYKTKSGYFIYTYDKNLDIEYIIEIGDILIINYGNFYLNMTNKIDKLFISIISLIFKRNLIRIYSKYNYIQNIKSNKNIYSSRIKYNEILFKILNDEKIDKSINNKVNIKLYLENILEKNQLNVNLQKYYSKKLNNKINLKNIINSIVKNQLEDIKYINMPNYIKYIYYIYNSNNYLLYNNIIYNPINSNIYNKKTINNNNNNNNNEKKFRLLL